LLYSKGAPAADVTDSSKAAQQQAEKAWLQTQVDKDAASYSKWKDMGRTSKWKLDIDKEQVQGPDIEMEVEGTRDKGSTLSGSVLGISPWHLGLTSDFMHLRLLGLLDRNFSPPAKKKARRNKASKKQAYPTNAFGEVYSPSESGSPEDEVGEEGDDETLMKGVYREMSQPKQHVFLTLVEKSLIEQESGGAASSKVEVSKAFDDVVVVVKVDEESGGATSSKCYYKV